MLLEVVLALTLFVFAATVITGGLNASVQEVERLRLNVHASDLAISVLSEVQMGLKAPEAAGPEPFEPPFDAWTWQLEVTPVENLAGGPSSLRNVEVIVRHQTRPIVRRLTQFLLAPAAANSTTPSPDNPPRSMEEPFPEIPEL
ncbi:MAG: hypothetical protein HY735_31445 [Verrucomicrobia bacterium]|nr:hypothetical protein [Verrucomicrobiota bacterium]